MKNLVEIIAILKKHKNNLSEEYGIKSLAIFGSVVRDEALPDSDIDILVEFEKPIGLDFVSLADALEVILGEKVDLVSKGALKPKLLQSIQVDLVYV
jgi:predicted nucleotidyltransferase